MPKSHEVGKRWRGGGRVDGMRSRAGYAGPVTTEDPTAESPASAGLEPGVPVHPGGTVDAGGTPGHPRPTVALGSSAPTEPLAVPTRTIIGVGTAVWALALAVTLVVPALHTGERSWWPWACVAGIALGAFAWWYVGRGPSDTRRSL